MGELGAGTAAIVFEAVDERSGERCALKVLREERARDDLAVARFAREARAVGLLDHPHVVRLREVGETDGQPWIALDLVDGPTLAEILRREGPLSLERTIEFLLPIIDAIAHAHDRGVVHRDLKPGNVLVDEGGARVTDFGIGKILDDGANDDLTREDGVIGTVAYMAPEQIRTPRAVDARADQWALGVILFQAATGRLPFEGESSIACVEAIVRGKLVAPSHWNHELPAAFDRVVLRVLSPTPDERFASVRALGAALLPFASAPIWSRWARAFPSASRSHGALGPGAGTLDAGTLDDAANGSAPQPGVVPTSRPGRRVVASVAALSVTIVLGATLLRGRAHGEAAAAAVAPTPPSVSAPTRAVPPISLPTLVESVAPSAALVPASVPEPKSSSSKPLARSSAARPVVAGPSVPSASTASPAPTPAPAYVLGDNGAPIIH